MTITPEDGPPFETASFADVVAAFEDSAAREARRRDEIDAAARHLAALATEAQDALGDEHPVTRRIAFAIKRLEDALSPI